jgi:hypothetical protein
MISNLAAQGGQAGKSDPTSSLVIRLASNCHALMADLSIYGI